MPFLSFLCALLLLSGCQVRRVSTPSPTEVGTLKPRTPQGGKPADPMPHYRLCQTLFATGNEVEAVDEAGQAMRKFQAAGNPLSWMLLGSIVTNGLRIDVHYNMGPKERASRRDGIVRPLSFRVWNTESPPQLLRILDFEIGYVGGQPVSAAIGETSATQHSDLGTMDPASNYADVRARVLEILQEQ